MKVLVINPGATSTKIAVFEEANEEFKLNIDHPASELAPFARVIDQKEFRKGIIADALEKAGFKMADFDGFVGRGGLLRHISSGTYAVNDLAIEDMTNASFGEHASNLGSVLAKEFGDANGKPAFFVDPVSVDEFEDVARVSGYAKFPRLSFFHALNQKAMARKAAEKIGKKYEDLNLIIVHMGGGISVGAHKKGRTVDVNNVRDEGAFSMDRGGSIPVNAIINMCFSGMTKDEIKSEIGSRSGIFSYLGTRDFREVEGNAFDKGDEKSKLVFDAFVYQLCKDIAAMSSVMLMDVDAIVLTGGMANSKKLCAAVEERIGKIAPLMIFPGEAEMESLAAGALRVLHGESAKEYK